MSARVVDLFEVIQVDRRESEMRIASFRESPVRSQPRLERPPVEQPGERIRSDLFRETVPHRVEAARQKREVVGIFCLAELETAAQVTFLHDFAEQAELVHAGAKASERVRQDAGGDAE